MIEREGEIKENEYKTKTTGYIIRDKYDESGRQKKRENDRDCQTLKIMKIMCNYLAFCDLYIYIFFY